MVTTRAVFGAIFVPTYSINSHSAHSYHLKTKHNAIYSSLNKPTQDVRRELLLKAWNTAGIPFRAIENKYFQQFLKHVGLEPICRQTVSNYAKDLGNAVQEKLGDVFEPVRTPILVIDAWTSANGDHVIGVIGLGSHWEDIECRFTKALLGTITKNNRCTAEDMCEKLQYCLHMLRLETDSELPEGDINGRSKYSIILADGGADIKKLAKLLGGDHLYCGNHFINLAVSDGMKSEPFAEFLRKLLRIVKHFRQSTISSNMLANFMQVAVDSEILDPRGEDVQGEINTESGDTYGEDLLQNIDLDTDDEPDIEEEFADSLLSTEDVFMHILSQIQETVEIIRDHPMDEESLVRPRRYCKTRWSSIAHLFCDLRKLLPGIMYIMRRRSIDVHTAPKVREFFFQNRLNQVDIDDINLLGPLFGAMNVVIQQLQKEDAHHSILPTVFGEILTILERADVKIAQAQIQAEREYQEWLNAPHSPDEHERTPSSQNRYHRLTPMIAEFRRGLITRLLKEWIAEPRGRGPNLIYTRMQNKAFACALLVNPYQKDLHSLKEIFEQEHIATAVRDIYTSWTDLKLHLFTLFDQEFRAFRESIGFAERPNVRRRLDDPPEQTQTMKYSIQDFLSPRNTRMSQDVAPQAETQAATEFSIEVRRYLRFPVPVPMDISKQTRENIAEWWSLPRVQHEFPVLRKFVVQFFCIMPSNATVERLWSSAKFMVGTHRQSLSEETYKGLLLSYCNQDLLE